MTLAVQFHDMGDTFGTQDMGDSLIGDVWDYRAVGGRNHELHAANVSTSASPGGGT